MKKPLKLVMLEVLDNDNSWTWSEVTRDDTPEKAVARYVDDMGFVPDTEESKCETSPDGKAVYDKNFEDVRAFWLEVK